MPMTMPISDAKWLTTLKDDADADDDATKFKTLKYYDDADATKEEPKLRTLKDDADADDDAYVIIAD